MNALDELSELPQWLGWKLEPPLPGKTKPRKVPYSPVTARPASTIDPSGWSTFDVAYAAVQAHNWTGTGFVFSDADPYAGIDLDGCRDADSGSVAPWACTIVGQLRSYTEVSPSGRGLHVIVRAWVPLGGNRKDAIELYDHARYFTVTGEHVLDTPTWIADAQGAVDALHRSLFNDGANAVQARIRPSSRTAIEPNDATLLEQMFRSVAGDRIRRLWEGDMRRYADGEHPDGNPSSADYALCSHLKFWTGGDETRADRLFRQSRLFREKWDDKRGRSTYGERTLTRVSTSSRSSRSA